MIDDNRTIHDDYRKILGSSGAKVAALDETEASLFGEDADGVGHAGL